MKEKSLKNLADKSSQEFSGGSSAGDGTQFKTISSVAKEPSKFTKCPYCGCGDYSVRQVNRSPFSLVIGKICQNCGKQF